MWGIESTKTNLRDTVKWKSKKIKRLHEIQLWYV